MLEYGPWSNASLEDTLGAYRQGHLTILDIQLGSACNFSCLYCDTPDRETTSRPKLSMLKQLASQSSLDWLFICGLGEPLAGPNADDLFSLLTYCQETGLRCFMFSNLSHLTDRLLSFVESGTLNILFKLDSLRPGRAGRLYGTDNPGHQLRQVKRLIGAAAVEGGCTNLAASIVTTAINKDEIEDLLIFCDDHGVFPLVADLEDSGRGSDHFSQLKLSRAELISVRELIGHRYGREYVVPICPSVIGGIHVGATNHVLVDEYTGLSCHWFWLKEPKVHRLMEIGDECDIERISARIVQYRETRLAHTRELLGEDITLPIGGCGGDIERLLRAYVDAHEAIWRK